jgi:hypothetical protein
MLIYYQKSEHEEGLNGFSRSRPSLNPFFSGFFQFGEGFFISTKPYYKKVSMAT